MKRLSARIIQSAIVFVVEAITILILAYFAPNIQVDSFWSALVFAVILSAISSLGWWLFIQFFGRLPAVLRAVSKPATCCYLERRFFGSTISCVVWLWLSLLR